jgi:hypothetical protein
MKELHWAKWMYQDQAEAVMLRDNEGCPYGRVDLLVKRRMGSNCCHRKKHGGLKSEVQHLTSGKVLRWKCLGDVSPWVRKGVKG